MVVKSSYEENLVVFVKLTLNLQSPNIMAHLEMTFCAILTIIFGMIDFELKHFEWLGIEMFGIEMCVWIKHLNG